MSDQHLLDAARAVRLRAHAPYSAFRVGAALLGASGKVWTGCNVESASYSLTCCAERVAVFKALSEGETGFVGVVVVADCAPVAMPCGACRQVLFEQAPDAWIVCADLGEGRVRTTVAALLPAAFAADAILARR